MLKQTWAGAAGQKLLCSSHFHVKSLSVSFPLRVGHCSHACGFFTHSENQTILLQNTEWCSVTIKRNYTEQKSLINDAMVLGGIKFKGLSGRDDCIATLTLHISVKDCRITMIQIPT